MSYNKKGHKSDEKKLRNSHSIKKVVIIFVIVIILFVGGFVGGSLYLSLNKTSEQAQETVAEKSFRVSKEISQANSDAEALRWSGKVDEAAIIYDNEVKNTDDAYKKSILAAHKSLLYFNDKQYDEALTIAQEAESMDQNITTVSVLGNIYEAKSDKQNAIKYFEKTITFIDKTQGSSEEEIEAYQTRITALGGATN